MIYLSEQRSQGVVAVGGKWGESIQESKLSNIWEWGRKGLPNPNRELFTEFYAFWVLPGGSFPQLSEAQTHFCHS